MEPVFVRHAIDDSAAIVEHAKHFEWQRFFIGAYCV